MAWKRFVGVAVSVRTEWSFSRDLFVVSFTAAEVKRADPLQRLGFAGLVFLRPPW
jgi:hypothetical protein